MDHDVYDPFATDGAEDATELARLADALVEQIGAARRHYDDLQAAIDGAAVPAFEPHATAHEGPTSPTAQEEAELVAVNMALTGGTRHEAHLHIVETFGIVDTDPILDAAFGRIDDEPRERRFGRLPKVRS